MTSDRQKKRKRANERAAKKRRSDHQSEFSAELANGHVKDGRSIALADRMEETSSMNARNAAEEMGSEATGRSLGWLALALSIASLFVLPQWLGLAGIVLGGAAWFTGTRGLGLWSMVIGAVSLLLYIVLVPYYV